MQYMELYVHIPFCVKKCNYCDFLSFPGYGCDADEKHHSLICKYVDALCLELGKGSKVFGMKEQNRLETDNRVRWFDRKSPATVFIGGGTPSVLDEIHMEKILKAVNGTILGNGKNGNESIEEFTIECNPGTVTKEKLLLYKKYGVNRLSFGLQSADNGILKKIGRIHTYEEFLESFELARECGFKNINIDLISAVPGQTVENWKDTLFKVGELGPEHISAYSLIMEEGTPLYEEYLKNPESLKLPDEDTEREIYRITEKILKDYGYSRYEISNYAKPGFECRHNIGYWTGEEYLGTGLGASSYLSEESIKEIAGTIIGSKIPGIKDNRLLANSQSGKEESGKCMFRIKNTESIEKYIECYSFESLKRNENCETDDPEYAGNVEEILDEDAQMAEFCILGLRMTSGISCREFRNRFGKNIKDFFGAIIDKYTEAGLLEMKDERIRFTEKGLDLSNVVLCEFV